MSGTVSGRTMTGSPGCQSGVVDTGVGEGVGVGVGSGSGAREKLEQAAVTDRVSTAISTSRDDDSRERHISQLCETKNTGGSFVSSTMHTILHVAQPVQDGVARVVADLARQQVAQGWDVSVACPEGGQLSTEVIANGARHLPWAATRNPNARTLPEARDLSRLIRSEAPDIVHLHSSKAGLAGRLAIRGRLPTVFSPHAWSFFHVAGSTQRAALAWEKFATRWADVVLCGSEDERRAGAEAAIEANFRVIPNTSTIDDRGLDQAAARAELGLGQDVPIIVCLGRYARQKGQDILLAAWPDISAAAPDAALFLVGGGPDEERLRAMADPSVQFVQAGSRDNVVRWILAADVLVFPSRWETMSLAVLEALELGRAVVVSDCQGMAEALAGGPGTVVPREYVTRLADAVTAYATDRELARRTGQDAGRHYREVHGAARAARFESYTEMLTGLIAARQSARALPSRPGGHGQDQQGSVGRRVQPGSRPTTDRPATAPGR